MKPVVSVVIPTFNRQDSLLLAIASVDGQTRAVDEIIVIDDGSTDGTAHAIAALPRPLGASPLKVIHQANRGPAASRNAGIKAARGEFIAFLDDDDIWLPTKLERQLEVLATLPDIAVLGCGADTLSLSGAGRLVEISEWRLIMRNWLLTPCVVARRNALIAVGGFPEYMHCCEDYALWLRLVGKHRCVLLNEVLVQCGHGKPSFGASGLSADIVALYAGEREALLLWSQGRRNGLLMGGLARGLATARHLRRWIMVTGRRLWS